jgi:hypothetical protein
MDLVFQSFLERQSEDVRALAAASDIVDVLPMGPPPAQRFMARFRCTGLVRDAHGQIVEANEFLTAIWLPDDFLRRLSPVEIVTIVHPLGVFHPNVPDGLPFMCLGDLRPGTPLVDIIFQIFEILTYQNFTCREDRALSHAACQWTRNNLARLPLDRRSLKRRASAPGGAA